MALRAKSASDSRSTKRVRGGLQTRTGTAQKSGRPVGSTRGPKESVPALSTASTTETATAKSEPTATMDLAKNVLDDEAVLLRTHRQKSINKIMAGHAL